MKKNQLFFIALLAIFVQNFAVAQSIISVEAESFITTGGIINDSPYGGPGFGVNNAGTNINFVNTDDYAEYTISVPADGEYEIEYNISTPISTAEISLYIDNQLISADAVPNNGQWDDYTPLAASGIATLTAGTKTLKIEATGVNAWQWNLDKITLTKRVSYIFEVESFSNVNGGLPTVQSPGGIAVEVGAFGFAVSSFQNFISGEYKIELLMSATSASVLNLGFMQSPPNLELAINVPATTGYEWVLASETVHLERGRNGNIFTDSAVPTIFIDKIRLTRIGELNEPLVSAIPISDYAVNMKVGDFLPWGVEIETVPWYATNKNFTWTSSDVSVVTVDPDGFKKTYGGGPSPVFESGRVVTDLEAIGAGTATITATSQEDSAITVSFLVTVAEISLTQTTLDLVPGELFDLSTLTNIAPASIEMNTYWEVVGGLDPNIKLIGPSPVPGDFWKVRAIRPGQSTIRFKENVTNQSVDLVLNIDFDQPTVLVEAEDAINYLGFSLSTNPVQPGLFASNNYDYWSRHEVTVADAGDYEVSALYFGNADRIKVRIDGATSYAIDSDVGEVYGNFGYVRPVLDGTITLAAGLNTVYVNYDLATIAPGEWWKSYLSVDYLTFTKVSSAPMVAPSSSMTVYPNPVVLGNDITVSVVATQAEVLDVTILDFSGQVKATVSNVSLNVGTNDILVNTSTLLPGLYVVKVGSTTENIVVQ